MANSVDLDQTAPIGAVCSGSTLFASILNSSVMLGNFLQQTTSADDIFKCIFFLALQGLIHGINLYQSKTSCDNCSCYLLFVCLFDLILYVPSTNFQLNRDRSSWVEPVLS